MSSPPEPVDNFVYEQELYRGLTLLGTFATSFAQQGVMASTTLLFGYGLTNGGPAVMLYVWIIGSIFSIIVGSCLAEICACYPYAGSVYQWAGELSTKDEAPLMSYTTGWLNFLGNATSTAGYCFGFGQFVAALYDIQSTNSTGLSLGYQVLIAMLGTTIMAVVNCLRIDRQAWLNKLTFMFSVSSLIIICVTLAVSNQKKQTFVWMFTTTYNDSGFNNFGYVVLTGVLTLLFGVAGYEASAHLAVSNHFIK
jgi:amino acid transporter